MLHVQAEPLQTICAPSSDFVEFQLVLYVCEFLLCQGGWHMHQWISFLHFTQVAKNIYVIRGTLDDSLHMILLIPTYN